MYASDFSFEDDPLILENGNMDDVPIANLMNKEPVKAYSVLLVMQIDRE
jgi:hypothetical protein